MSPVRGREARVDPERVSSSRIARIYPVSFSSRLNPPAVVEWATSAQVLKLATSQSFLRTTPRPPPLCPTMLLVLQNMSARYSNAAKKPPTLARCAYTLIYPAYKAHIPSSVLPAAEASAISSQATIPAPAPELQSPQQGVGVQEIYKLASTRIQKYWFNWTKRSASNMLTTRECASCPVRPIYLSSSPYPL